MSGVKLSSRKRPRSRELPTGSSGGRSKGGAAEPSEQPGGSDGSDDEHDKALSALLFGGSSSTIAMPLLTRTSTHSTQSDDQPAATGSGNGGAVWADADDGDVNVDVSAKLRLRKLRETKSDGLMAGTELERRLRARFSRSNVGQAWAEPKNNADEDSSDDEEESFAQDLLANSDRLIAGRGGANLRPGNIFALRCKDANQHDPSKAVVRSVQFHSSGELLLTAGLDKTLRFFQVDGEENSKVHGVMLKDLPITQAAFTADDQVILSGDKPHFYYYDVQSGAVQRVPSIRNAAGKAQSTLAKFALSPNGEWIAFAASAGYIMLVSAKTKQWAADFKLNCSVEALVFSPDSRYILASGRDAEVYKFDVRHSRCVQRMYNEGGTGTTGLDISPPQPHRYMAVGSESGVVNIYDSVAATAASAGSIGVYRPKPLHAIMNLTTPATIVKFNSDSQVLAIASSEKKDALRLVHVATGTVFANWPTQRTPLGYPFCLDFSPSSNFLAVGNDKGRVLLYRCVQL
eukprot:TRINITY_DN795_c0_g1_i4.p1 TRINITY_DN795_c0_g1~~TRINITY_DN795_c0_g1_i4.p1  ORF type:complete len:517 (+),score=125.34 TRINITY_DN795_c0_g1_i4:62-1612(+)